jgi:hypothetical protein
MENGRKRLKTIENGYKNDQNDQNGYYVVGKKRECKWGQKK